MEPGVGGEHLHGIVGLCGLAAGALRQGELTGHAAFGEAVVGQHADAAVDLHGEVLGIGRVKACSGEGGVQSGVGSVHAVKTGSLGVGLGGGGTAEPGINGGVQHGDDFLSLEHGTTDAAVAALGQAVAGLSGSHSGVGHRGVAGCVDLLGLHDLTALGALVDLFAILRALCCHDLHRILVMGTAGELLDRAADQVGDLLIQVIHLAHHGIVDLTADLITDPVAQLAGQELVHGVGHLVVHDITGACTQLADLIRDQIGHAGQQVFLQAVHDLLGRPAAVHALLCIGGCIFRNLAHLVHEGRVIHQLVPDLCTDFLHRGGTQFGLEELCVGLILHELIHGQVHGVIHQRTGQGIPFFIIIFIPFTRLTGIHNVLYQLQHHITDDLRIVSCLFLVIRHTKVINRIVHGVIEDLPDTGLGRAAALHITCQLIHHIGDGVLRQEAVVQAAFQVGNGIVQRLQGVVQVSLADLHIAADTCHRDLHVGQLGLHGAGDLIQRIKGFFLGLGIFDGFLCICQSLVDDCINIFICRLAVQIHILQGSIGSGTGCDILCRISVCDTDGFRLLVAVITGALVLINVIRNFLTKPYFIVGFLNRFVVGKLVRQGGVVGTEVGQILRICCGAALTGTMCRPGLLLAGGLIVVHILAPGVGDGLDLSRFHITAVEAGALLLTLCIAGRLLGHFPLAIVMDDLRICGFVLLCHFPVLGQLRQSSGLVLLCHFPVLRQFRQCSGLVLLCHLPVLGQFRQCSSFVSLGIDIGFVSLRVGVSVGVSVLLLGLGRQGVGVRVGLYSQHRGHCRQRKAGCQGQCRRTAAPIVDDLHLSSSFR